MYWCWFAPKASRFSTFKSTDLLYFNPILFHYFQFPISGYVKDLKCLPDPVPNDHFLISSLLEEKNVSHFVLIVFVCRENKIHFCRISYSLSLSLIWYNTQWDYHWLPTTQWAENNIKKVLPGNNIDSIRIIYFSICQNCISVNYNFEKAKCIAWKSTINVY